MLTYSIGIGTDLESNSYDLRDELQLEDLLFKLKDNSDKLIEPKDIRDSILSIFSNTGIKETYSGSFSYIGIDTLDTDDRDLKNTILIGKRSYSGTYSYDMSHDILIGLTNSDIYFYNNKEDNKSQLTTELKFLAGDNINLYKDSPYISSQLVKTFTGDYISLNIFSNNNMYIDSSTISINSIIITTASNDYVFINDNGVPKLSSRDILDISNIFDDDRFVTYDVGNIVKGEIIKNVPIYEVLRRILYTNAQIPTGSLKFLTYVNGYAEIGTFPKPIIEYTINKKSNPTDNTLLINTDLSFYPPIIDIGYISIIGTTSGINFSYPVEDGYDYVISVGEDIYNRYVHTISLSAIYPYFYGTDNIQEKLIEGKSDKQVEFNDSGYLVFMYPYSYGQITSILNQVGINVISDFTYNIINLNSPDGYWLGIQYYLYKTILPIEVIYPLIYTFSYA